MSTGYSTTEWWYEDRSYDGSIKLTTRFDVRGDVPIIIGGWCQELRQCGNNHYAWYPYPLEDARDREPKFVNTYSARALESVNGRSR